MGWVHAVRCALVDDPRRLVDLLVGRTPLELHGLQREVVWLRERVSEGLDLPLRAEVLAMLHYDLPLATSLRVHRTGQLEVLRRVQPWVIDELCWLLRERPDGVEARLLRLGRQRDGVSALERSQGNRQGCLWPDPSLVDQLPGLAHRRRVAAGRELGAPHQQVGEDV
jgi:hypothetical protein